MPSLPDFSLDTSGSTASLRIDGDWTVTAISDVERKVRDTAAGKSDGVIVDLSSLGRIDTSGAYLIHRLATSLTRDDYEVRGASPQAGALMRQAEEVCGKDREVPVPKRDFGLVGMLERTGRTTASFWYELVDTMAFLGETLVTVIKVLINPLRMRWTSLVSVMEDSGLDAVPIVVFLSFFVGMVVAFIGASTLSEFGASIFVIELVGVSMLREFGVILTAIILAGRTNSAFTAQIGSMKMRQEVDAMTTLGLNPMEVLVAPRVIAMIIIAPVLAFLATLSGLAGGVAVGWLALDLNPTVFLTRLQQNVPLFHFWVGIAKAPVFGLVVALIGCRQGLETGDSVQSLGTSTTKSVVQALFAIIVIDALFAMFYMQVGL